MRKHGNRLVILTIAWQQHSTLIPQEFCVWIAYTILDSEWLVTAAVCWAFKVLKTSLIPLSLRDPMTSTYYRLHKFSIASNVGQLKPGIYIAP